MPERAPLADIISRPPEKGNTFPSAQRTHNGGGSPPPVNPAAECAVLSAMISREEDRLEALTALPAEAFTVELHRWIFETVATLTREGQTVDEGLVALHLTNRYGDAFDVCAFAEIVGIFVSDISPYLETVQGAHALRQLIETTQRITDRAHECQGDVAVLLDQARQEVNAVCANAGPTRSKKYQTAADVMTHWRDDVLHGAPPVLYSTGAGCLSQIEFGPKLLTLIGGAPGAGKTAMVMQAVLDAMTAHRGLRVLIANVEMPPAVLLDRQLSRLSTVPLSRIRMREIQTLPETYTRKIDAGLSALEMLGGRLAFLTGHFDVASLAAAADAHRADVISVDYIQRCGAVGEHNSKRGAVDEIVSTLRQFAMNGLAVVCVSAVGRSRDSKGRASYEGLNQASFRESSELEFGADSAWIVCPSTEEKNRVTIKCVKNRFGEPRDIELEFDRARQTFTAANTQTADDEILEDAADDGIPF